RGREANFFPRSRGGQFGGNPDSRLSDHPVRSTKGGFAISYLMSRPLLLCEEGNPVASIQSVPPCARSRAATCASRIVCVVLDLRPSCAIRPVWTCGLRDHAPR